ncbi:hypothetical protein [Rhodococcus triatomae]
MAFGFITDPCPPAVEEEGNGSSADSLLPLLALLGSITLGFQSGR